LDGKITIGAHRHHPREKPGEAGGRPSVQLLESPQLVFRPPESRREALPDFREPRDGCAPVSPVP
jgi:hypothetical protein